MAAARGVGLPPVRQILCLVISLYQLVVLVHVIASWVPAPPAGLRPVFGGVAALVDPIVAPLRRVIPPLRIGGAMLDSSLLVLILVVILLQAAIC